MNNQVFVSIEQLTYVCGFTWLFSQADTHLLKEKMKLDQSSNKMWQ